MKFEAILGLQRQAASLLLYQAVLENTIGRAFLALLVALQQPDDTGTASLHAYGQWFQALATTGVSWQSFLLTEMLQAENPFTQQVQRSHLNDLPAPLVAAARQDLRSLQMLYSCDSNQLSQWVQEAASLPAAPVAWENHPLAAAPSIHTALQSLPDWAEALPDLAAHYRQMGTGLFAAYRAFRWQAGTLAGISHPDPIRLHHLTRYEWQKAALVKNTEALLSGYAALHVLLYGSRGSGKSSLVKSLLHEYGDRGLRLIEVAKADLGDLPAITDRLRSLPQKFILFVDDLSFEEDDDAYKALKVVLEGNLTARPQNVVVYATSNRRHLIREFFGDRPVPRDGDEIHAWDTVQEKLSFSDRFGLTLTFEPVDQAAYLDIVRHLAQQAHLSLTAEELEQRALQWATRHNGRSGRTARQFIDFLSAEQRLGVAPPLSAT
ncbi:ATP-binding protein [Phormidium tenue FACHB-886]|nr:ATP-binding protein [Phormidium tenue FACHB-886]